MNEAQHEGMKKAARAAHFQTTWSFVTIARGGREPVDIARYTSGARALSVVP
jgi:hypothetical protein